MRRAKSSEPSSATIEMAIDTRVSRMGILLDSNFNFKTEGYIKVARACEPYNLFWLEIDSYDPEGLRLIRDRAPMPIASCESLFSRRQFRPFFENRSIDVSIIDVPWNGLAEGHKISTMELSPFRPLRCAGAACSAAARSGRAGAPRS